MVQFGMIKRKKIKQLTHPNVDNIDLMIADVPIKVSFTHGDKTIYEYEDVFDLEFTQASLEGRYNGDKLSHLKFDKGISTENALFDMVYAEYMSLAEGIISELLIPGKNDLNPKEVQIHLNRNGEITYRKRVK